MTVQSVSLVLSFTQDMMLEVIEGRWDDVIGMQKKQDQMLKEIFSDSLRIFAEQEKEDLFEVQRLNQEITVAAELQKTEIACKLRDMRFGKRKAGAYLNL